MITHTSDGPFIDFGNENAAGERQYVSVQVILDAGAKIGMLPPQAKAAYEERLQELERTLSHMRGIEQALDELRWAVNKTLTAGAVEIRDGGRELYRLRPKHPGAKRVDVGVEAEKVP